MGTEVTQEELQKLIKSLPKAPFLGSDQQMIKYEGYWYDDEYLKSILKCQRHFIARDTDLFINSLPKTGTTWLKSLLFSVVNRTKHPIEQSPLLNHNPHELVHGLETHIYGDTSQYPRPNQLDQLSSPRLLSTHLPYASLPESIRASRCKILYITRNPSDMLVSQYYFTLGFMKKLVEDYQPPPLEDFFEAFCQGNYFNGPYFNQVLEYWKISLEQPEKVLFLKYEDLMSDTSMNLKRLAEFVGLPFSIQEENDGVVKDITQLCSFNNIKELDINKSGVIINEAVEKKSFFRKGQVGDWTNHFTPLMAEKMHKLMEENLKDTGLSFQMLPHHL